jgi:hypothetical protein
MGPAMGLGAPPATLEDVGAAAETTLTDPPPVTSRGRGIAAAMILGTMTTAVMVGALVGAASGIRRVVSERRALRSSLTADGANLAARDVNGAETRTTGAETLATETPDRAPTTVHGALDMKDAAAETGAPSRTELRAAPPASAETENPAKEPKPTESAHPDGGGAATTHGTDAGVKHAPGSNPSSAPSAQGAPPRAAPAKPHLPAPTTSASAPAKRKLPGLDF